MHWSTYAHEREVPIQLINNGDDCVVFLEEKHLAQFQEGLHEWFLEMGFNMKIEDPVYELEKVVFCQTQPVWTPDGYVMVRDPRVSLAKDCYSIHPLDTPSSTEKYLHVLGSGGMSLTGGVPVWQELYALYSRTSLKQSKNRRDNRLTIESGMMNLTRGMSRKYVAVHPQARYSFWRAFDIDPDLQCAIEHHYSTSHISFSCPPVAPKDWWTLLGSEV